LILISLAKEKNTKKLLINPSAENVLVGFLFLSYFLY